MQQMNVRRIVERIAQRKVGLLIEMSLYAHRNVWSNCVQRQNDATITIKASHINGNGGCIVAVAATTPVKTKHSKCQTNGPILLQQRQSRWTNVLLAKLYEFHWMCALFSRMNIDRSYLIKRTFNIHWRKIARLFGFSCFKVRIPYIITHSFIVVAHYIEQWFNENIWASMHLHMHMLTRI